MPKVADLRKRLNLTQKAFAERYRFNLRTVQNWESRERRPDNHAILLLNAIDRDPNLMAALLAAPPTS
jgi:putative transcriptional regulator